MPRFKSRRRSFGRIVRRARPIIKAVTGITLAKRIQLNALTIPDVTSVDFDNPLNIDLVECVESIDEEVESDGSAIADVPLYSRLLSLRFRGMLHSAQAGSIVRWVLCKLPDGESLVSELAGSFHSSNDSPTYREFRKNTLAKGMVFVNASNLAASVPIFVRKAAWARASPMRENDKIRLILAKDSAGTTISFSGFGTIYARANA